MSKKKEQTLTPNSEQTCRVKKDMIGLQMGGGKAHQLTQESTMVTASTVSPSAKEDQCFET